MRFRLSDRKTRAAVVIGLLGLVALVLLLDFESAQSRVEAAWSLLKSAPAPIYFGFMAVVLLAPVPASLLYVTAGPLYGIGLSLLGIAPALAINTLLVHMIAGGWLRPGLERLVAKRDLSIPRLETRSDQMLFITLVRITPGIPYFVQSWLIGLADVDRIPFIVITVAIQMLYATGFVVLGRSAFEGEIGLAIGAGVLLVFVSICARLVHNRFRATPASQHEETSHPE